MVAEAEKMPMIIVLCDLLDQNASFVSVEGAVYAERLQNIDIKRNYRMLISYAVNYTLKLSDKHSLFSHLIYLIVLIILCCVVLQ